MEEGDGSHGVRRDDEKDEFGASEGKGKDVRYVRRSEEKEEGKEETEERRKIEIKEPNTKEYAPKLLPTASVNTVEYKERSDTAVCVVAHDWMTRAKRIVAPMFVPNI